MKKSESDLQAWKITGPKGAVDHPNRLITLRPPPEVQAIPIEVSLLLPITDGNRTLLKAVAGLPITPYCALGLCLVDPFLNMTTLSNRLNDQGIRWVVNFPSVAQHEPAFESYLNDVDLGLHHELDRLCRFKELGFRTLAVMCHSKDAAAISGCNPDAVVHVPNVASFLSGVPKAMELETKETAMRKALNAHGWTGPFLNYCVSKTSHSGSALIRP